MIKDINIIIPLRDEDVQAEITVRLLNEELKDLKKKFVITLIDDHSTDETWNLLSKLKEKYRIIEIFKNEYDAGFGNALRFGIEINKCDSEVLFMGDCSDDTEDILIRKKESFNPVNTYKNKHKQERFKDDKK